MELTIKRLSPELGTTYCDFLSGVDFSQTPHWASCFCRFYHLNCSQQEWMARTLEQNRAEALREIEEGNLHGYLAFDGDTCVGWCNASDVGQLVRLREYTDELCSGKRVGCTICYVIHPDYRNQGVARMLLHRAIEDFRAAGYEAMLALPVEAENEKQKRYRGTLHMYQQEGYQELQTIDQLHIMWLKLSENETCHPNLAMS